MALPSFTIADNLMINVPVLQRHGLTKIVTFICNLNVNFRIYFRRFPVVLIVGFELVNVCWETSGAAF